MLIWICPKLSTTYVITIVLLLVYCLELPFIPWSSVIYFQLERTSQSYITQSSYHPVPDFNNMNKNPNSSLKTKWIHQPLGTNISNTPTVDWKLLKLHLYLHLQDFYRNYYQWCHCWWTKSSSIHDKAVALISSAPRKIISKIQINLQLRVCSTWQFSNVLGFGQSQKPEHHWQEWPQYGFWSYLRPVFWIISILDQRPPTGQWDSTRKQGGHYESKIP